MAKKARESPNQQLLGLCSTANTATHAAPAECQRVRHRLCACCFMLLFPASAASLEPDSPPAVEQHPSDDQLVHRPEFHHARERPVTPFAGWRVRARGGSQQRQQLTACHESKRVSTRRFCGALGRHLHGAMQQSMLMFVQARSQAAILFHRVRPASAPIGSLGWRRDACQQISCRHLIER